MDKRFYSSVKSSTLYREVAYIQSSGTQWIKTNTSFTNQTKVQFAVNMQEVTGDTIIGDCSSSTSEAGWTRVFNYNRYFYLDYCGGANYNRIYGGVFTINKDYNLEFGNRYVKDLDTGTNIISSSTVSSLPFDNSNIGIFKATNKSEQSPCKAKIYYVKIYADDGETLLKDFIPVILTSDIPAEMCNLNIAQSKGTVGLWDKVENKFYANSGTGVFTYAEK